MNPRNFLLVKAAAALGALWLVVWGVLQLSGVLQPSPEKIESYVEANPLDEIDDPDERLEVIGKVAEMMNQLTSEQVAEVSRQRREGENDERDRQFFQSMSSEEQRFFMEKRVGKAFDQMMVAFNEMDRDERRKIVERTLQQMKDGEGGRDERFEEQDSEMVEKVVNEGLRAYYQEASAETKLDLAPVLEQMQRNLGRGKGRPRE